MVSGVLRFLPPRLRARPNTPALAAVVLGLVPTLVPLPAAAEIRVRSSSLHVETVVAAETDEGDVSQARFTLRPEVTLSAGRHWRLENEMRLEVADDDTGLGTIETYDDVSRPLTLGPDARVEIDRLALTWRKRRTHLTVGKQTFAWGVLDGLQVTDRLDPVRLREGVFTETRPDRISRWGARARFELGGIRADVAGILDGTANQLALPDDAFSALAPRSRGGVAAGLAPGDLAVDTADAATLGVRLSRGLGAGDISLLVFDGPETEPILRSPPPTAGMAPGVTLAYPSRTLVGATLEQAMGPRVWRVEVAHVPDQPVNRPPILSPAAGTLFLQDGRESRWLAGVGMDWDMAGTTFLNAQLGVDHIDADETVLVRPETDVIATLRVQRSFANERWRARAEVIGSLSDGDGAFRPSLTWQASDQVAWDLGADLIWGDQGTLIGQFEDASRVFVRARVAV